MWNLKIIELIEIENRLVVAKGKAVGVGWKSWVKVVKR